MTEAVADGAQTYAVTVRNTSGSVRCRADQTVLQAAIQAGIDFPYTCASGNCGACIAELHAGEVSMLPYGDGALSAAQRQQGRVLACRARPCSDIEIMWLGRGRR